MISGIQTQWINGKTVEAEEIGELKKLIQNYMKEESVRKPQIMEGLGHTLRAKNFGPDPRVGGRRHPFYGV